MIEIKQRLLVCFVRRKCLISASKQRIALYVVSTKIIRDTVSLFLFRLFNVAICELILRFVVEAIGGWGKQYDLWPHPLRLRGT